MGEAADQPGKGVQSASSEPDPFTGQLLDGRFRIGARIARGGMGRVYRAEQLPLGRQVAVKVLDPLHAQSDPHFHERFFLEAATCAKLTHLNTITIFDYGQTDDDVYYIVMELLEGQTLSQRLKVEKPLPVQRALHIAGQICRSLREAHGLGVIHRDLKPANVMLVRQDDDPDFVKVLDFGLVKPLEAKDVELTQGGFFVGSPKYLAPEQARGERLDARSDVYALGVILYEMVTGAVPFQAKNAMEIVAMHMSAPVPDLPGHVPEPVAAVIRRCLSKKPDDRFESMDALLAALKLAGRAVGVSPGDDSVSLPIGEGSAPVSRKVPDAIPLGPSTSAAIPEAAAPRSRTKVYALGAIGIVTFAAVALLLVGVPDLLGRPGPAPSVEDAPPASAAPGAGVPGSAEPGPGVPVAGADADVSGDLTAVEADPAGAEAPSPATDPSPEPAPAPLRLSFRSEPAGARVLLSGQAVCEATPCEVEWPAERAADEATPAFTFRRQGFFDATVEAALEGEAVEVRAELRRRPPPRPPRTKIQKKAPAIPEGYKADPY